MCLCFVDCNECTNECPSTPCPANSHCVNNIGSYTCPCNSGFVLSGALCRGEWQLYIIATSILDLIGTHLSCFLAYCAIDIDECTDGTHQCHAVASCTNTIGSYICLCLPGTTGNGRTCVGKKTCRHAWRGSDLLVFHQLLCYFIDLCDECRNVPTGCGAHNCNTTTSDCANTIGSFQCSCRFGQASNGVSCARTYGFMELSLHHTICQ